MASDLYFPNTPGLTWRVRPAPTFSTVRQRDRLRRETRLANDPFPLWSFELEYEFLRDYQGVAESMPKQGLTDLETVVGFFCARLGSYDSFLLDPSILTGRDGDNRVPGVQIGVGDGVTTAFQLVRNYGTFQDIVEAPRGTASIFANGAPVASGWTQSATGLITFATPPATGVKITAAFIWAWRVHFSEDTITPEQFSFQLYELQSVKLVQDRQ